MYISTYRYTLALTPRRSCYAAEGGQSVGSAYSDPRSYFCRLSVQIQRACHLSRAIHYIST